MKVIGAFDDTHFQYKIKGKKNFSTQKSTLKKKKKSENHSNEIHL